MKEAELYRITIHSRDKSRPLPWTSIYYSRFYPKIDDYQNSIAIETVSKGMSGTWFREDVIYMNDVIEKIIVQGITEKYYDLDMKYPR